MLTVAGVQVPLIPFVDVLDKIGATLPLQISLSVAKVGNIFSVIVCESEAERAHWLAAGVKV